MRVKVLCPLCREAVTLTVVANPVLTHSSGNGVKGFITIELAASGVEHTCQRVGGVGPVVGAGGEQVHDDDLLLECKIETVLSNYGIPTRGFPLRTYEPKDGGPVILMPMGDSDRGDLASDLADTARLALGTVIE